MHPDLTSKCGHDRHRLKSPLARVLTAAFAITGAAAASAQTGTVTMTDDRVDIAGAQQGSNLPGPDRRVSFREAWIAVNNTPGPQTIEFGVPQGVDTEWSGGVAILYTDCSVLSLTDDETTVDFATQTAFTGDTNPNGNEVGVCCAPITGAPAIYVSGNRCVIRGMDRVSYSYVGHAIQLAGTGNHVVGRTISGPSCAAVYIRGGFGAPPASRNIVGGVAPGEGNVLSAGNHSARIDIPAENSVVIGNRLTGVYAGVAVRGNAYTGSPVATLIGGPTTAERNFIASARRYGEEGFPDGAQVSVEMAVDTLIEGNYVGATADGPARAPSQIGPAGVSVADSIGTAIRSNLISGIRVAGTNHYAGQLFGGGIAVTTLNAPTSGTRIENNLIGTTATGAASIPNLDVVRVVPVSASRPITQTTVDGNTIAFNERTGVVVACAVSGVQISGTSIHNNGGIGSGAPELRHPQCGRERRRSDEQL